MTRFVETASLSAALPGAVPAALQAQPSAPADASVHASSASAQTPLLPSRLPRVGTTVFTLMSNLAAQHDAVNLGQGFPDFDCDPRLVDAVTDAMKAGHNQYPPMIGVAALRENIAAKVAMLYGRRYDPATEITVTAGATQAILTAILCSVLPGDEVIVIEPAYDAYGPAVLLAGGTPVYIPMAIEDGGYVLSWERVAAAVTPATRMIIINSPHNPTGTMLTPADLRHLAEIVRDTRILILADEVYEHMVYDGARFASVCSLPELAARAFVVSSFGKTYHVTGWKVGYVLAPPALSVEFRKVHQFNVFTVNTPMQHALANYLRDPAPYRELGTFYQGRRDLFRAGLADTRFRLLPVAGTYFQCVDYSAISDMPEAEFSRWLTSEIGVAAIPMSAFYDTPTEAGIVRFCFAKKEQTLRTALERLARL